MHPIRLTNAVFEGENVVYLLDPEDAPTTLIDAGANTDGVSASLRDGLADAGVDVADLDRILLTHWHPDHTGLAGELQRESNASVHVHQRDAPLVSGAGIEDLRSLRNRLFRQWGLPAAEREGLIAYLDGWSDLVGEPVDVTSFEHGTRFPLGDDALRVVHLPGHADGHAAFVFENRHEAFVGDVILPKYTPNVGGADPRVEGPIATYLSSLRWLAGADLDRAWPGHRDPIDDPAARAREIVAHHEARTENTLDAVRDHGPATAWEVSAALFGDLEDIHVMHGPGEAWAHLEHLVETGALTRDDGEVVRYDLAE